MSADIRTIAGAGRLDAGQDRRASPSTASPIPASRATRSPRRCSPTACISSAARSSITGRAASCPPARKSPTRWSRSSATRRASSRTCAPPCRSSMTGSTAQSQNRWPSLAFDVGARQRHRCRRCFRPASTTRPSCGRRRPGRTSTSRRSAPPPASASRPTEPDPDHYSGRFAHCDVLVLGGGAAGLAAALAAAETGARVILADEQAGVRRRAAFRDRREDRRPGRLCLGAGGGRQAHGAWTMSACCRARRPSAITRRISSAWSSASPTICRTPAATCRASGCGRSAPSASCSPPAPSSATWCLPTTTGPASCWRRRRAPISTTTASRSAGMSASTPPTIPPMRRRST